MTPRSAAQTELDMVVAKAHSRAAELKTRLAQLPPSRHVAELSDHRVVLAGDMADALDRITPGLGLQWMQLMYPDIDLQGALA